MFPDEFVLSEDLQVGCSFPPNKAENLVKMAAAEGAEAVVEAMEAHRGSAAVQEFACRELANIASSDESEVEVAETGGIEAIVAAMKAHEGSAVVQEHACAALAIVADSEEGVNIMRIYLARGIEAVVAAMRAHPGSAAVQEHACSALGHIVVDDTCHRKAESAGAIEAVVAAMNAQRPSWRR
eukprot:TRINITY_DN809_c0_g1_i3.p1 TRINITY_DN809_c0_g1~~TRINITY_DN809_c0_g1_i3.p1  ORF type:complete len:183 (-),score=36.98 TRINITY_DN809_c0_g1_i3:169-717(-)